MTISRCRDGVQCRDALQCVSILQCVSTKSRRDDTLLSVGFNLRTGNALYALQSPAGTTHSLHQISINRDDVVSSLRDLCVGQLHMFRRLKPTVNKVSSLRDFVETHCNASLHRTPSLQFDMVRLRNKK